jgi:hypothetical protein
MLDKGTSLGNYIDNYVCEHTLMEKYIFLWRILERLWRNTVTGRMRWPRQSHFTQGNTTILQYLRFWEPLELDLLVIKKWDDFSAKIWCISRKYHLYKFFQGSFLDKVCNKSCNKNHDMWQWNWIKENRV